MTTALDQRRPSTSTVGSGLVVALLVGLLVVLGAWPASAHTYIIESRPANSARLATAPTEVWMRFDEPVEFTDEAFRLLDAQGNELPTTSELLDEVTVVTHLPALPPGSYLVAHRLVAEDGHVARGAVLFTYDPAGGSGPAGGAAPSAGSGSSLPGLDEAPGNAFVPGYDAGAPAVVQEPDVSGALAALEAQADDGALPAIAGLLRALGYAAALLIGGAMAWIVAAERRDQSEVRRGMIWAVRGILAVMVASLLLLPVNAMLVSGDGVAVLGTAEAWDPGMSTVALGAVLRAATGGLLLFAMLRGSVPGSVVLTGGLLATFLVDGHTRGTDPVAVIMLSDAVHLAAAAVWLGGLVVLAASLRERRLADDPVGAADAVARFSTMALWAVGAVAVSGTLMAGLLVGEPGQIIDTAYGWTLLAKVALVGCVVAIGWFNRQRLVPVVMRAARPVVAGGSVAVDEDEVSLSSLDDAVSVEATDARPSAETAWYALRITTVVELAILAVVLLITGALVALQPGVDNAARAESSAPGRIGEQLPADDGSDREGLTPLTDDSGPWTTGQLPEFDSGWPQAPDPVRATTTVTESGRTFEVAVEVLPGRVGANVLSVDVTEDGEPADTIEFAGLRLASATLDVGELDRKPEPDGRGRWVLGGSDLITPGTWTVEFAFAIDRFTLVTASVDVEIAPA